MKTPREILLERHQAAAPKLDVIRRKMVTELNHKDTRAQRQTINFASWYLRGFQKIWHELICPSRRIWASLAAIWVFIAVANVSMRDHSPMTMAKSSPSPEMIVAYQQQEKLLAELIGPNESQVAESPKTFLPRPSSERRFEVLTT